MTDDAAPMQSLRTELGRVAPAILLIALVGLALSLTLPLLAIEMERMGVSSTVAGLSAAVSGLANILVVPFVPRLAARLGTRTLLIAALLGIVAIIPAFKLWPYLSVWFGLRFLFGVLLGTLFTLGEFWIASTATQARRGMVMGVYATGLGLGFALGPALLVVFGTVGWAPYLAATGICFAGAIPLLLAPIQPPPLAHAPSYGIGGYILAVPAATIAAFATGSIETAGVAHLPVVGLRSGYDEAAAALFVATFAAGNVVSQIPMGLLADRIDKRRLLAAISLGALLAVAVFAFVLPVRGAAMVMLFIAGGLVGSLYTVGLAHLGSRFIGPELAGANAAFVVLYSSGIMLGPPFVGVGMDWLGPRGFAIGVGVILAIAAVTALARERHPSS